MVDRESRLMIAEAIEMYLDNLIDNSELENKLFRVHTKDRACAEITDAVLFFSSEWKRHYNRNPFEIATEHLVKVRRWIIYLKSTIEWPSPQSPGTSRILRRFVDRVRILFTNEPHPAFANKFWPFKSHAEWEVFDFQHGSTSTS